MTDSPFLPGTNIQFAWDSTSLGYLKQCPRLYQYIMIEGWAPKDESIHLRFGIEYHNALENYDRLRMDGLNHNDAVFEVVRETLYSIQGWDPDPDTKPGALKNPKSLIRTIVWYMDQYQDDRAETYTKPDGSPAVELSFRFELDWGPNETTPYVLCGHLDRVVTFNDEVFGTDHKTTSMALTDYYFAQFEPNNQMSLYTLATKVILNATVKGIIIDAARLTKDGAEFGRRFTYRTSDQLEEWVRDLRQWLRLAEGYAVDGYWPQNDTACDKYGGCRFRQICSKSPQARGKFLEADFIRAKPEDRWNPLRTR
jgi:hypothetical protein